MWEWNDGTDVLMHHGIKGQKWGVRRFQNPDMTYTAAGKERYSWASRTGKAIKRVTTTVNKVKNIKLTDKQKKALKIGVAVVGTALVAYGAYKIGTSDGFRQFINIGRDIVEKKRNEIADVVEQHDIKKRILDEIHTEIDDNYRKATIDVTTHVNDKLRNLYEQMEKVESMRNENNSSEVDRIIADLYGTRKSIIAEQNNALMDLQKSYNIKNIAHNILRLQNKTLPLKNTVTYKWINKLIAEGKNINKYDERKISDLISGDNQLYMYLKSVGENPESYGFKYRKSRIV